MESIFEAIVIRDRKKLGDKITRFVTTAKKMDDNIHVMAVSSLYHAQQCGDVRCLERLIEAMPKSSRSVTLMAWCEANAPLSIDRKTRKVKLRKGRKADEFLLEEAAAKAFWEFAPEKDPAPPMSLDSLFRKVKMAAKAIAVEGESFGIYTDAKTKKETKFDLDAITKAKAVLATLEA